MSAIQTTIPFKSRKLRFDLSKIKIKKNDENLNTDNIVRTKANKKRTISQTENNHSLEECSPKKISRIDRIEQRHNSVEENWNVDICEELPGREKEIRELKRFLETRLREGTSGSLYVSGQPGTGKTACLSHILQIPQFKEGFKCVFVNCTMIKSAGNIYKRICEELKLTTRSNTEKACLAAIEKYLYGKHKMTLLVLDEIDQLDSKKQSVLYTIFEWAGRPGTKLALVGIANALNLTERVLPRLQAKNLRPELMHFQPYTREQIVQVLKKTIASGDKEQLFSPPALQMLAAKVSALCGDMRRALELARRVLELARRTDRGEAPPSQTVELRLVLSVLNDVYGGAQRLDAEVDESFPLQQKLVICSLILMLTKGKSKDIVVSKLYEVYRKVARSRNIAPVDSSEFVSVCGLIETRGLVRVSGSRGRGEPRAARVTLQSDLADVRAALADKTLLSSILSDVNCLA